MMKLLRWSGGDKIELEEDREEGVEHVQPDFSLCNQIEQWQSTINSFLNRLDIDIKIILKRDRIFHFIFSKI